MVSLWIAVALAAWAAGASVLAGWFARERSAARRQAHTALRMAADAVEAKVEMERNTPVMVMLGPDGRPAATAPLGVVRWWRN